MKQRMLDKEK